MLLPFSTSVPTGFNLIFVNLPAIDAKIGVMPTVNFLGELTELVLLFFLLLLFIVNLFFQPDKILQVIKITFRKNAIVYFHRLSLTIMPSLFFYFFVDVLRYELLQMGLMLKLRY